ncbi:hypothetical protein ACFRQM_09400 [Streptomyces sp. NPDC056831]|uniref:hypothetical protein n=1 Tax=Streptomyces sp. NPDC056831 TaxID=3345954 RepID=UPI00369604F4
MSLLPHSIPVRAAEQMAAALAAAGTKLGPFKPGTRVTRTVDHQGATWELTYMGPTGWRLTGPGAEHGIGVDAEEAAKRITAPPAEAPALQPDPFPRAPATYAGVLVPALVREHWTTPLADGWRLGVRSTLAAR